jgi:Na+/serine symporter
MKSTLKGLLIAPSVPGLVVLAIASLQGGFWEGLWAAAIVWTVCYSTAGLAGLPLHLLLVRRKLRSLVAYLVAGFIATLAAVFVVLVFPVFVSKTSQSAASLYPIGAAMVLAGEVVAFAFWLIARPDLAPEEGIE